MKILYYTADLSYETKVGTQLTSRFSAIDMDDVLEWVKQMAEWLDDYSYKLLRADIRAISEMEVNA